MYYSTKKTKELINNELDICYKRYRKAGSGSAEQIFWLKCLTEVRKLKNCNFSEFKTILNDFNYDFKSCSYYTFKSSQKMLNEFFI